MFSFESEEILLGYLLVEFQVLRGNLPPEFTDLLHDVLLGDVLHRGLDLHAGVAYEKHVGCSGSDRFFLCLGVRGQSNLLKLFLVPQPVHLSLLIVHVSVAL